MGAACMKSQGGATPPAAGGVSAAQKVAEATAAAAEHSMKAHQAAETAAACAKRASAEAAALTGRDPEQEQQQQQQQQQQQETEKNEETKEQQGTATQEQTQQQTTDDPQTSSVVPLSDADAQLLAAAQQQAAATAAAGVNTPHAYLFYASELNEGSLIIQWTSTQMNEEEMHAKKLVLLASFIPPKHKTVPKSKLTHNGGITYLLQEMTYKWEIWNKVQRQGYYQGWLKFIKAADEMEASIKIHKYSEPAPPAKVFLLHSGPIENKVLPVMEEESFSVSVFGFAAVTPPPSPYKAGANISPKRFGEIATAAGGGYVQLSRRGGNAAFDEAEVVRWLAADGLEIKKGEGITLDSAGTYERRSEKKGGNAAASDPHEAN
ncbi:Immune mapped protein-1, related [Eimeria mitis]|uniref:Immune mapped protein-1, related n=1 Tax=Eimeria mitis TaxID=44415 RepID=U6JVY4_9EIME|nr:Immune mapped protein-1, related [Eimeria mitis]CDJ27683.1 Immune mapped protein-1, related [Eimeria mitis]